MLALWHASEDDDHPLPHPLQHDTDHTSIQPSGHEPQRASSLPTPTHGTSSNDGDSKSEASWYQSFTKNRGRRAAPIHHHKFDPEKALPVVSSHRPLKPARSPPDASIYDYFPIFRFFKWLFIILLRRTTSLTHKVTGSRTALGRKIRPELVESNVPLEIFLYLSR
jgi:putative membrane protein